MELPSGYGKTDFSKPMILESHECPCGSGQSSLEIRDARGIYLGRVCTECKSVRLEQFRQDVLTDSSYEHDEPLDEEG